MRARLETHDFLLTARATIHLAFLPACLSICLSIVVETGLEIMKLYRAQSSSDGFEIWFQGSQQFWLGLFQTVL